MAGLAGLAGLARLAVLAVGSPASLEKIVGENPENPETIENSRLFNAKSGAVPEKPRNIGPWLLAFWLGIAPDTTSKAPATSVSY